MLDQDINAYHNSIIYRPNGKIVCVITDEKVTIDPELKSSDLDALSISELRVLQELISNAIQMRSS